VVRNSSDAAAAAAADPAAGLDARLSRLLRPLAGLGPLCQTQLYPRRTIHMVPERRDAAASSFRNTTGL